MSGLPDHLLDAIWDRAHSEAEADELARRWQRVLPDMEAAAKRIRAQVRESRCRCQLEPESVTPDGRCGRCLGAGVG